MLVPYQGYQKEAEGTAWFFPNFSLRKDSDCHLFSGQFCTLLIPAHQYLQYGHWPSASFMVSGLAEPSPQYSLKRLLVSPEQSLKTLWKQWLLKTAFKHNSSLKLLLMVTALDTYQYLISAFLVETRGQSHCPSWSTIATESSTQRKNAGVQWNLKIA